MISIGSFDIKPAAELDAIGGMSSDMSSDMSNRLEA